MTMDINKIGNHLYTLYDDVIIPTELADIHYKSIITKRNQWMIKNSNIVICYTRRNFGGAYAAMKYAKKIGKSLLILQLDQSFSIEGCQKKVADIYQ